MLVCHVIQNLLPGNVLGGTAEALEDVLQMGGVNMADQAGWLYTSRTEVALFASGQGRLVRRAGPVAFRAFCRCFVADITEEVIILKYTTDREGTIPYRLPDWKLDK
jgi:hypothetical protein